MQFETKTNNLTDIIYDNLFICEFCERSLSSLSRLREESEAKKLINKIWARKTFQSNSWFCIFLCIICRFLVFFSSSSEFLYFFSKTLVNSVNSENLRLNLESWKSYFRSILCAKHLNFVYLIIWTNDKIPKLSLKNKYCDWRIFREGEKW